MSPKRNTNLHPQNKSVTIYTNGGNKKDKKQSNANEQSRNSVENWEFHFKLTDLDIIKTIIKTKDLNGIPLIIGAAVLNQKDILITLLKHGYNINEADKNNLTPLAWSIKLKQLEMAQLLLAHDADPSIKPINGDDILCMAAGSPLWDEESCLSIFNTLKASSKIDVNAINKNGLSLLHLAVRRQWNSLVDALLTNDVNINIKTNNGVTPLMLASYRNDYEIVMRLLNRGVAVKRRNADGFTALCYAYSSAIAKELQPPFVVIEKLQDEMNKNQVDTTGYLKDRLKLMMFPLKGQLADQPSPAKMVDHIFTFTMRYTEDALKILTTDLSCGKLIKDALEKFLKDKVNIKLALIILNAIFKNVNFTLEIQAIILKEFVHTGCLDMCIKVMRMHADDSTLLELAVTPIIIFSIGYLIAHQWYESNKNEVCFYLPKYEEALELLEETPKQLKFIQERLTDFKTNICVLPCNETYELEPLPQEKNDPKTNTKKSKRRTKALKAKIAKMKTAELTERFNLRKSNEYILKDNKSTSNCSVNVEDAEGTQSIRMVLDVLDDDLKKSQENATAEPSTSKALDKSSEENGEPFEVKEDWKQSIKALPFHKCINKMFKPPSFGSGENKSEGSENKAQTTDIDVIIKYLEGLLGIIVNRYKEVWHHDRANKLHSDAFDYASSHGEADIECIQNTEKEQLRLVHREFYNLTRNVKEAYEVDPECCFNILKELERFLLSHNIRGETIIDSVAEVELVKLFVTMPVDFEQSLSTYMENIIAGDAKESEHVQIIFKEHLTADKQFDANSMGDYVYLNEITHLPIRRCIRTDIPEPPAPSLLSIWDEADEKERCCYKGCKTSGADLTDIKDSKWCSLIRSLEMMDDAQIFLNGAIRISNAEKRKSHVLSPSSNNSVLEIGLAPDNKPLAIKILQKSDPYAILLKSQIDPLLTLRYKYLLPYHTCAYDGNLLVIATPLCEYNLGQYVLKMRHPQNQICKVNVIRQMLSGLMYLHDHDEPIIHGNLKPSNILIDTTGTIRVAEFGIHKAILKTKNLPESSVIWFATELYKMHKQSISLEWTCASDIQVAGMLVHFANNCGLHPFGKDVPHILKNLEEAVSEINATDMELYDLLTWMLMGEPTERPTIHQALSHIFFWSKQKKWTYILLCAGLGIMSTIPMDIEKLHNCLDKVALKENIAGNCWVVTAKKQYPEARLNNTSDTPSGLLKFIKDVVENNLVLHSCEREKSFSNFILSAFPHFVLSLYRMIENTEWSDHRVFMPFHNVVDY